MSDIDETDPGAPAAAPNGDSPSGDAVLRRKTSARPADAGDTVAPEPETPDGERIAKTIARAGIASRRDAEVLIADGRVSLNGQVLTSPAINVTESDSISIDGEPLPSRERTRLWILHKPRGVVTTARDPEGRQTVFDILPPDLPRVVSIGRLDINTEGLLLLTNDGGLAKVIAHPETGWLRRYRVRAFGSITQAELDKLRKGVSIEGMDYGPIEASLDREQGDNVWLTLGLREGKNREVKRILEYLGLSVNRLLRLSFGPFQLGDLEQGLVEEVRTRVLKDQLGKSLAEQASVDFESPVREPVAPFGRPSPSAGAGRSAKPDSPRRSSTTGPAAPQRSHGAGRSDRDRPAPTGRESTKRVPTGGTGPGPRRSIWHADDAESRPHGSKVPRRGDDPKAARHTTAERTRERVGSITSGERRVLVERLQPNPEPPPSEPHRRVKFRKRDDAPVSRGERDGGQKRRPRRDAFDRPPPRRSDDKREQRPTREGFQQRPPRRENSDRPSPRRDDDRREQRPSREGFQQRPPRREAFDRPAPRRDDDGREQRPPREGFQQRPPRREPSERTPRQGDVRGEQRPREFGRSRTGEARGDRSPRANNFGDGPKGRLGGTGHPGGTGRPGGQGRPGGKPGGQRPRGPSSQRSGFDRGGKPSAGRGGKPSGSGPRGRKPPGGAR